MNRFFLLVLWLITVSVVVVGTAGAVYPDSDGAREPDPAPTAGSERIVTVTDDLGKTVTIRGIPQKVVSLAPSNTEILYTLGLENRIVGVTDYCDYPPAAADKPKVGGYNTVNVEKVIAAEPDLILAAAGNTEEVVDHLRALGMTVVSLCPETIDDVLWNIELVGKATGEEERAEACIKNLQERIRAVSEVTGTTGKKPSVAHVVWHDPLWISGNGTFQNEVITMAGGINAFGSIEGWSIVSLEEFIITDPDYILISSGDGMGKEGYDAIYAYFMNEPRMQKLDAVRNGHVSVVDSNIISRGSPRIVDALEEVAGDLHPDLFGTTAPKATPIVQSPGFGVVPLIFALFAVALLRVKS